MKKYALMTMTGALLATGVQATPTIYPKDVSILSKLTNPTNSNLVADDSDSRIIWVMPPNTAYSKVGGLHTPTTNLGFCQEMANLQGYSASMSAKILDLQNRMVESEKEMNLMRDRISDARQDLANHIVTNNLHNVTQIDDRILTLDEQIAELTGKLETCEESCNQLSSQIKELRKERVALTNQRRDMIREKVRAVREMESKKASVEAYEKDLVDFEERYEKRKLNLEELREKFLNMYTQFGKMEGARASISFESSWDQNIQDLYRANPGYEFKHIHTQNAVINTSMLSGTAIPGESAVLNYEIAGQNSEGKITYPSYPANLSGNLRLSLIGACPILKPELFGIKIPTGTDQMKYGMVISYEFPSTFEVDVTAHYNMYKMYQKVVKSKKRGGFFSSSKKTSITEKNFFKDEFKVTWNEQDAANRLSEEQKADYEKELRDSIFGRLAVVGLPTMPNPGALVAPETGPNGAAVLASSLAENPSCKANKWCVAATIGVNVLNAVFGSSRSAASYTNIQDVDMTERWSRKEVVYKPWVSSYK